MYSVVDGYSVYIKGLPLNATPALLEKEFKKFGPIRQMAFKFEATWDFVFDLLNLRCPMQFKRRFRRRQSRSMDAMLLLRKHARQTHMQLDYMWQMDWLMG
ncbi:putative RNA recognition motif domain, RNA-binding domain superfamily [Helianthus annuus]|nr:putative RNA recognition motif domain, RNA-binding domain superfamily [Helianthus annuus]